jgi:Zn-dependent protease
MPAEQGPGLPRIRGLLLIYCIALTIFFVHNTFLTIGSIIVYGHSAATGAHHVPLGSLVYYVISNVAVLVYVIYISVLMRRRRRSAIVHNVIFNLLSAIFLLTWHAIGEKSGTGTIVDSIPNIVIVVYFLLSRRVRKTFVVYRDGRSVA